MPSVMMMIHATIGKKYSDLIEDASNSDGELLFMGFMTKELNIHWKLTNWAKTKYEIKSEFNITDPFITQCMLNLNVNIIFIK
jgi:hypothetical protein